jgi:hypothetical protein
MRQKLIFSILFFLVLQATSMAQSMNAYINAADKAFDQENFYSAVEYYKKSLEFDSTRVDLKYRLAESARLFNAYNFAIKTYEEILESESADLYPSINFRLGELYQTLGEYDKAITKYNLYLSEYKGQNTFLTSKAEIEILASEWAQREMRSKDENIMIDHLDQSVNTKYSEFGAILENGNLMFSSMRYQEKSGKNKPPRLISKILEKENGNLPTELSGDISLSENSIANATFNSDRSVIYYTVCDYLTDSELRCDIYSRSLIDSVYSNPVKLPINVLSDSITTTQPTFGFDPGTQKEFLIFSSNREGGVGGLDLWRADIIGDNIFSDPVNLQSLNTKDDEITPFYHSQSATLFFSTDGRRSFGGYDIFSTDWNGNEFGNIINLGASINSSFNDIYYSVGSDELMAHFSSNRTGSYYIDELQQACCYDIYKVSYENLRIDLNILTFDALLKDSLPGVTVSLIDPVTGDIIESFTNDLSIDHAFELKRGRNYLVVSQKEGFNSDTISISTRGINSSKKIIKKVYLTTDMLLLDVTTFDKITLDPLNGTTLEIINITDGRRVHFSGTNPLSNGFKVYIDKNKIYEIIASKSDYTDAITTLDTKQPQEGQIIKRKLFLEPILFDDYLPLVLYFDNDMPDRRSIDMYTSKSYSDVYSPFIDRKEIFKTRYGRRVAPSERQQATEEIDAFFKNEVEGGFTKLNEFLDVLYSFLKEGRRADLSVKGYTSPLAATKYNLALGQRRVSSVKNEIRRYKNGVLMPYITSGTLTIRDISFGETLSPDNVSDRSSDTSNSIYSVDASKERRVEIIKIKIN